MAQGAEKLVGEWSCCTGFATYCIWSWGVVFLKQKALAKSRLEEKSGRSQPLNIVGYYYVLDFPDAETMMHEEDASVLSEDQLCYFQVHCSLKGYTVSTGKKEKKNFSKL